LPFLQAKAVEDVNDVAKNLITSRKVVFTPNTDILATLKATSVQITCIDKDGKVVKRVQDDSSNEEVEEQASPNPSQGGGNGGGTNTGDNGNSGGTGTIDTGGGSNTGGNSGGSTGDDEGNDGGD